MIQFINTIINEIEDKELNGFQYTVQDLVLNLLPLSLLPLSTSAIRLVR